MKLEVSEKATGLIKHSYSTEKETDILYNPYNAIGLPKWTTFCPKLGCCSEIQCNILFLKLWIDAI